MKRYQPHYRSFSSKRIEKRSKRKLYLTVFFSALLTYFIFFWFLPNFIGSLTFFNKFKNNTPSNNISDQATLAPPVLNIPYEATNTAVIKVRGYSTPNSQVEIYLEGELKNTAKSQEDGSFTSEDIPLSMGSNNLSGQTVDERGEKSLPSKSIRIVYDNEKPKLEISEPQDNLQISSGDKSVKVSGTSDAEATVTVNNTRLIVKPDGSFSQTVGLNDGDNNFLITATDPAGNLTQLTRRVVYQQSEPTPTP